ncbi:ABC transporter ATP-binding protein [Streptomyces sp. HB2AG]|uniref:ABC transporter ATP-binding protein n=1 Tax=Streptomyces sp. HB2AG TaxID=2983400 RepID=UPI0022AAE94F|nr:ATP-binding cassette domain-containing protein [Streptomyces sp. HB2AG]MCZ2524659.1 ATP-binding cassette domain-containing protein [Streptomyces sp. HB2AG]
MIRFEHATKRHPDGTTAVEDLSFEVGEGEVVALVGPSGCGKTTTMTMVNRLTEPTSGRVLLDGRDVAGQDPVLLRRRIGYVIQQVGLLPHRTVLDNAATVPRLLGRSKRESRERAAELLDLVGLDPAVYGHRWPHQLSGGQRQRVGVARALAADPPVLLMDEPFGAVDPVVRERLQREFLELQRRMRRTVLFVTHDVGEAVRLGDRIAVYGRGRIEQLGTPAEVLGAPASPYVADFVGAGRTLGRLSVTGIAPEDLERPPVLRPEEDAARAAVRLAVEGARRAVVLGPGDTLEGWVPAAALSGGGNGSDGNGSDGNGSGDGAGGSVRDHLRPVEAAVPASATLEEAFGTMIRHDEGWVAVLDGERFLGVLTPERLHGALRRPTAGGERVGG